MPKSRGIAEGRRTAMPRQATIICGAWEMSCGGESVTPFLGLVPWVLVRHNGRIWAGGEKDVTFVETRQIRHATRPLGCRLSEKIRPLPQ
ncbi:MAG: hypothetical protein H6669_13825 [Ardenticatenaceae bacterium]|nr:hypothetical protein [Ardenticatenaceae bacterium]